MITKVIFVFFTYIIFPQFLFAEADVPLIFIINADNPTVSITSSEIRDFFFKRKRQWSDGESVRFIDRTSGVLRDNFLLPYLKKNSSDVDLFWIGQKLYSGDSAPLREASEATTIQFVSSLKGAISYVSSGTALPKGVKILKVEDSNKGD